MTDTLTVPGGPAADYAIRAQYAVEDVVEAGDVLLVRDATAAEDGQLVIATLDGHATCRRYPLEGDMEIIGRVVGLVRSLA